jgi:hypothetical protein
MERRVGQKLPRPHAPRIRRVLIAFLAAVYLVVGFAGEISCAEESLGGATPISTSVATDKVDEGSKATVVVEHCYTCVPITIPAPIQVSQRTGVSVHTSFPNDALIVIEARLIDPPPPKFI